VCNRFGASLSYVRFPTAYIDLPLDTCHNTKPNLANRLGGAPKFQTDIGVGKTAGSQL